MSRKPGAIHKVNFSNLKIDPDPYFSDGGYNGKVSKLEAMLEYKNYFGYLPKDMINLMQKYNYIIEYTKDASTGKMTTEPEEFLYLIKPK